MAILSRRVFQTPLVKWILPARIRDQSKNDVVFVGETQIQLKEWDPESVAFVNIASIDNFNDQIRAAAVLGKRRAARDIEHRHTDLRDGLILKSPPQILVLILGNHQLMFITAKQDNSGYDPFETHSRAIPIIDKGQETETHLAIDSQARAIAFTNSDSYLVVYGLDSSKSYRTIHPSSIIRTEVILPIDGTVTKMEFLYPFHEDPERVILLVLGLAENKYVVDLYSWDASSISDPESIQINRYPLGSKHGFPLLLIPLMSEISGGYVILVEEKSMLLYLVSPSGSMQNTSSIDLRQDTLEELQKAQWPSLSSRSPLWTNWVRPLRNPEWRHEVIYLGREDGAIMYVQIGSVKPATLLVFELHGPAGTLDSNIDTAMAILDVDQARRNDNNHAQFSSMRDESRNYQLGYPDTLMVASTSGSGGLYEIGYSSRNDENATLSREELHTPKKRLTFPNWAPFYDLAVLEPPSAYDPQKARGQHLSSQNSQPRCGDRQRLLAATGNQPHGAICELRYGVEVPLKISRVPQDTSGKREYYEKFDLQHCNGVWPIVTPHCGLLFLFSYPWCSILALLDPGSSTISDRIIFRFDEPTLALTSMNLDSPIKFEVSNEDDGASRPTFVVCICSTHIRILMLQSFGSLQASRVTASLVQVWEIPNSTCAAFRNNSTDFLIATPKVTDDIQSQITLKRIMFENDGFQLVQLGIKVDFTAEISCLAFIKLTPNPDQSSAFEDGWPQSPVLTFACVGMLSGSIRLVRLDEGYSLKQSMLTIDTSAEASTLNESNAIESIAALQTFKRLGVFHLLCGSRDGVLHILEVEMDMIAEDEWDIISLGHFRKPAGDWPVRVLKDQKDSGCAIVWSGSELGYINLRKEATGQSEVSSVFFSDPDDSSFSHGSIDAMAQIQLASCGNQLSGCIVVVSQGAILVGHITQETRPVPLRRPVPGTPSRIMYSRQLNRLVVGSTVSELSKNGNKRYIVSTIFLLDPNIWGDSEVKQEDIESYDLARTAYRCLPGEKLLDLMEYRIPNGQGGSHDFVVATIMFETEDGRDQGKILCLKEKQGLSLVHEAKEPAPVFAICQTERGALVYCCGNDVRMRVYDPLQKKFQKFPLINDMASPGVKIWMTESLVMIVTQLHSLRVYELDEDRHMMAEMYSDCRPRMGISSLDYLELNRILLTTMPKTIAGFRGVSMVPEFEAVLPNQVTHLVKANLQPPWKRRKAPGIEGDDIYGIAVDGSLFSFNYLSRGGFELLRFLEILCSSNPRLCPAPRREATANQSFDMDVQQPKDMVVDGDILASLLKTPDPEAVLKQMLATEPPIDPLTGTYSGLGSSEDKKMMLDDLVYALPYVDEADSHGGSEEPELTIRLLRHFLQVPL